MDGEMMPRRPLAGSQIWVTRGSPCLVVSTHRIPSQRQQSTEEFQSRGEEAGADMLRDKARRESRSSGLQAAVAPTEQDSMKIVNRTTTIVYNDEQQQDQEQDPVSSLLVGTTGQEEQEEDMDKIFSTLCSVYGHISVYFFFFFLGALRVGSQNC